MEKIIKELIQIKEDYNNLIEDELFSFLNYEDEYRDLTEQEINKINKARKDMFYLYKGIEYLDKIQEAK